MLIQHKDSCVNGVNDAFIIFFFLCLTQPGIHDQFLYPIQGRINQPIFARNIIYRKTEGIVKILDGIEHIADLAQASVIAPLLPYRYRRHDGKKRYADYQGSRHHIPYFLILL